MENKEKINLITNELLPKIKKLLIQEINLGNRSEADRHWKAYWEYVELKNEYRLGSK